MQFINIHSLRFRKMVIVYESETFAETLLKNISNKKKYYPPQNKIYNVGYVFTNHDGKILQRLEKFCQQKPSSSKFDPKRISRL
jgi:hypothetical protein